VTLIPEIFTLYKLRVFPVATPNNATHITKLDTKVIALGYSRRTPYYITFTEMPRIRQHMLEMATTPDMLTDPRRVSLLSSWTYFRLYINIAIFTSTLITWNQLCTC